MKLELTLNSIYICVHDMERAIDFYEKILGQSIGKKDEVFSVFDIKGFRFCLFNNSKVNEKVVWGDNCLPSFQVNNLNLFIEKLKDLGVEIVFPLTKIGDNLVLEFKDSEGNDVEVYERT